VQEARQRGWLGGFLRGHPDDDSWRRLRVGRTPRLVVLDYAETRDRDLRRLLELADAIRKDGGPVLRVILLAREYSEWWTSLAERGESLFQSLIGDCARAYYLAPIELDSGARTALFAAASSQLGALLGDSSHTAPPPLDDTAFARPLYVIAAAFASCLGQRLLDGGALLEWILTHEALFWSKGLGAQGLEKRSADEWSRVGQGSCGPLALSLAAVTLLGGAQSQDDADAIVVAVSPDLPSEARDRVRRALADLYPIGEAYSAIAALEPDLLGERLVSHALARDPGLLQRLRAILLAEEQRIQRCLEVLGRIAIRDPSAEGWIQAVLELDVRRCALPAVRAARGLGLSSSESVIGDGLASVLESSAANAPDSAFLRSLEFELPEYSTVLLRVSGWVAERLLELPSEADGYAERARRLVSFAVRAAHLGEREAAKQAAEEAVLLYRKLAQRNPGAFEPDLAISLSNLGHTLSEIGERKRAKRATQEAVSIFRDLAKRSPRTSESALASTLVNLGSILGELGEREAAKDAAAEAVSLYRDLTQRSPGAFVPGLARSLSSLSKMCRDLGEHEVAETHANEAVSLYRELAHRDPGAFEPGLANALNSMAAGLCEVDAYETARGVIEEAIRILLALTHRIPLAFEPELAMSLNNLSGILSGLGERDAAKEIAEKVVRIRRKLVQRNPGAFRPALASALASLGKMQSELGEHETARESASEAVLLYLELEHGDPGAFTPRLATALNNLGNVLGDLGDREGAKEAAEAAVGILRGLARRNPAAFEPVLATALSNLAVKRGNLYDYERAKEASEEAVRIVRAYAQEDSESHRPALANALHGLGIRLSSLGERETSKAVTEEAVLHFRMLAQRNPGAFKPALASALNNLGNRLSELGELEGAKRAAEEAVGIYRELAQRNPGAFEPLLARALLSLGLILQSDKALEDAARVFREGLRTVLPSLPRFSKALAPLAAALRDAYLRSAAAGDLSLDQGLLNAIDRLIGRPSDEPGSESP
jgi:tetratricopeptide (TPR) repeat protein